MNKNTMKYKVCEFKGDCGDSCTKCSLCGSPKGSFGVECADCFDCRDNILQKINWLNPEHKVFVVKKATKEVNHERVHL